VSSTAKKKNLEVVEDDGEEPIGVVEDPNPPAAEAEPEVAMVPISFRSMRFEIPRDMDEWQTEACLAMNQSNYVYAAKLLLGDRQWAQLMAVGDRRKDIREFLTVFAEVVDKDCVA
jgi:hypothetical protein